MHKKQITEVLLTNHNKKPGHSCGQEFSSVTGVQCMQIDNCVYQFFLNQLFIFRVQKQWMTNKKSNLSIWLWSRNRIKLFSKVPKIIYENFVFIIKFIIYSGTRNTNKINKYIKHNFTFTIIFQIISIIIQECLLKSWFINYDVPVML